MVTYKALSNPTVEENPNRRTKKGINRELGKKKNKTENPSVTKFEERERHRK